MLLRFSVPDMCLLVNSIIAACVLHNLYLSENDVFDFPDEEVVPVCNIYLFAREGHQLQ